MLEKVRIFYEHELKSTKFWISKENKKFCPTYKDKKEAVWNAVGRCCAVAMFVQYLDVPFEEIDPLYMEYKEKLEDLLSIENLAKEERGE